MIVVNVTANRYRGDLRAFKKRKRVNERESEPFLALHNAEAGNKTPGNPAPFRNERLTLTELRCKKRCRTVYRF